MFCKVSVAVSHGKLLDLTWRRTNFTTHYLFMSDVKNSSPEVLSFVLKKWRVCKFYLIESLSVDYDTIEFRNMIIHKCCCCDRVNVTVIAVIVFTR